MRHLSLERRSVSFRGLSLSPRGRFAFEPTASSSCESERRRCEPYPRLACRHRSDTASGCRARCALPTRHHRHVARNRLSQLGNRCLVSCRVLQRFAAQNLHADHKLPTKVEIWVAPSSLPCAGERRTQVVDGLRCGFSHTVGQLRSLRLSGGSFGRVNSLRAAPIQRSATMRGSSLWRV